MADQHPRREDAGSWGQWNQAPDDADWAQISGWALEYIEAGAPAGPAWRKAMGYWLDAKNQSDPERYYLYKTRHWVRVKICARIAARDTCELCKRHRPYSKPQVHHVKYAQRHETLYDVALLCDRCHADVTADVNRNVELEELGRLDRAALSGAHSIIYGDFRTAG